MVLEKKIRYFIVIEPSWTKKWGLGRGEVKYTPFCNTTLPYIKSPVGPRKTEEGKGFFKKIRPFPSALVVYRIKRQLPTTVLFRTILSCNKCSNHCESSKLSEVHYPDKGMLLLSGVSLGEGTRLWKWRVVLVGHFEKNPLEAASYAGNPCARHAIFLPPRWGGVRDKP